MASLTSSTSDVDAKLTTACLANLDDVMDLLRPVPLCKASPSTVLRTASTLAIRGATDAVQLLIRTSRGEWQDNHLDTVHAVVTRLTQAAVHHHNTFHTRHNETIDMLLAVLNSAAPGPVRCGRCEEEAYGLLSTGSCSHVLWCKACAELLTSCPRCSSPLTCGTVVDLLDNKVADVLPHQLDTPCGMLARSWLMGHAGKLACRELGGKIGKGVTLRQAGATDTGKLRVVVMPIFGDGL